MLEFICRTKRGERIIDRMREFRERNRRIHKELERGDKSLREKLTNL